MRADSFISFLKVKLLVIICFRSFFFFFCFLLLLLEQPNNNVIYSHDRNKKLGSTISEFESE